MKCIKGMNGVLGKMTDENSDLRDDACSDKL